MAQQHTVNLRQIVQVDRRVRDARAGDAGPEVDVIACVQEVWLMVFVLVWFFEYVYEAITLFKRFGMVVRMSRGGILHRSSSVLLPTHCPHISHIPHPSYHIPFASLPPPPIPPPKEGGVPRTHNVSAQ